MKSKGTRLSVALVVTGLLVVVAGVKVATILAVDQVARHWCLSSRLQVCPPDISRGILAYLSAWTIGIGLAVWGLIVGGGWGWQRRRFGWAMVGAGVLVSLAGLGLRHFVSGDYGCGSPLTRQPGGSYAGNLAAYACHTESLRVVIGLSFLVAGLGLGLWGAIQGRLWTRMAPGSRATDVRRDEHG